MKRLTFKFFLMFFLILASSENSGYAAREVNLRGYTVISSKGMALAVRYMFIERWDLAEAQLRQILYRKPNDPAVLFNLGVISEIQENYDKAIQYYETALEISRKQLYRDALDRVRTTLSNPTDISVFLLDCEGCEQGVELARKAHWYEALTFFRALSQYNEPPLNALLNLAVATYATGDKNEADRICRANESLLKLKECSRFLEYIREHPIPPGSYQPETVPVSRYVSVFEGMKARPYLTRNPLSQPSLPENPDSGSGVQTPIQTERVFMKVRGEKTDVAVRSEPSLLSKVIHAYRAGEKVEVLNTEDENWACVKIPAGKGYMLRSYLDDIE